MAKSQIERDLVYGVVSDNVIVMHKAYAEELAQVRHTVDTAKTWKEFQELMPEKRYQEIMERMREYREDALDEDEELVMPNPDDPFDSEELPGYFDGDWPGWPQQEMLDWLPKDLIKAFGNVQSSSLNGYFLEIAAEKQDDLVKALEARGYVLIHDEPLVKAADGRE